MIVEGLKLAVLISLLAAVYHIFLLAAQYNMIPTL